VGLKSIAITGAVLSVKRDSHLVIRHVSAFRCAAHPVYTPQVDLAQLHALFVRRFGRFRSVSSSSSGNGGGESGGFQRACSSSCAAVERVRRKLLSSSKGLRGLRAALRSVSGGAGGRGDEAGSLTKVRDGDADDATEKTGRCKRDPLEEFERPLHAGLSASSV